MIPIIFRNCSKSCSKCDKMNDDLIFLQPKKYRNEIMKDFTS